MANAKSKVEIFKTITLPNRSDNFPAKRRTPSDDKVKQVKNKPLFLIPKKSLKSGIIVNMIPKENTERKVTTEGAKTRVSKTSFGEIFNRFHLKRSWS